MTTTLDILNSCCKQSQKIKGGVNLGIHWLNEVQLQEIIDEFPIEVFDPTTDEQDEALQKWFNKLKLVVPKQKEE
jgi:hypothetical protein